MSDGSPEDRPDADCNGIARTRSKSLRAVAGEPLVHFLLLGGFLFILFAIFAPADTASRTIVVDRPALLEYLQYRAKRFDSEGAARMLDNMSEAQRDELVADYVDQEVLYRQAVRYGLDQDDDVIKQRMVQKSRFIVEAGGREEPEEAELRAYYREHIGDFSEPRRLTFTHVFFDAEQHGEGAQALARDAVSRLNARNVGFSDVHQIGDRFPYLVNYVERPLDYVAQHFGENFATEAVETGPADKWVGPWRSQHGWHAVMVTENIEPSAIPFEEVRSNVASALVEKETWGRREEAMKRLKRDYDIRVEAE